MKSLPPSPKPDIFVASYAEWFGLEGKTKCAATEGVQAWINPEEYRRFVAKQKRAFEDQVDDELGVEASSPGPLNTVLTRHHR